MSLLNGASELGVGLNKFAGQQAASMEDQTRAPLVNAAPEPKSLTPTYAELDTALHGNALDPGTLARAHQVFQGLTERGMDPATAIGFTANAVQESRANPNTNPGDMGASHGLMQWRADRLAQYQQMFGNMPEKGDLNQQLDYIMKELSGPESRAWQEIQQAPQDPASRAGAVSQYYERPKDTQAEITRRGYIATQLAHHFAGLAANQGEQE